MRKTRGRVAAVVAVLLAVVVGGLVAWRPWAGDEVTVIAAGDIARCNDEGDEATAELVEGFPDATILALGDLAYDNGTVEDFEECYDPTWGAFRERTRPVPGNHEYRTDEAAPYFDYFGDVAGEEGKGWYSFDLGAWHIVALNTNCDDVGCDEGSEQEQWLRADLAADDSRCTLAFSHHPRFSSGAKHGGTGSVRDLWRALIEDDVELVLSGHEHLYERTAPLDGSGDVDPDNGLRQFVVGTGGGNFYDLGERIPGSEAALTDVNGVLTMTLQPDGYEWEFLAVGSGEPGDSGSGECR